MAYLIVMEGENKGMGFELPASGIITIGRAPANSMVIDAEGVLDYHGVLNIANGAYTYMDKGSANGSSVNGKPVRSAKLYRGDVLRLGEFPMMLDGEDVPMRGGDIVPPQVVPRPAPVPPKQASASSPETQPSPSAPQCPKCGAKISKENAKFCPECGEPLALKPEKGATPCPAPRSFVLAHGGNAPVTGKPSYPNLSDKWAWTLACVPIFWMILNIMEWGWVLLFGLGIAAILLDAKELRKNGHNPNNWMILGLVLIPVYLFVRAYKTNKKYGYAITSCVLVILVAIVGGAGKDRAETENASTVSTSSKQTSGHSSLSNPAEEAKKEKSRETFKQAVLGKTPQAVIATFGKADDVKDGSSTIKLYYNKPKTFHPFTLKPDREVVLSFESQADGGHQCSEVHFFPAAIPLWDSTPVSKRMPREAFEHAILGKTPQEVIVAVGRPDFTRAQNKQDNFYYLDKTIHPFANQIDEVVYLEFSQDDNPRCTKFGFLDRATVELFIKNYWW